MPAAQAGLHGLAGTFGRVAYGGAISSLTKCGPIAANAVDAALAYSVMSPNVKGHSYENLYDGGYLGVPHAHLQGFADITDFKGVKIGLFKEWFDDSDPRVRQLCQDAVDYLTDVLGVEIVHISIPHLQWLSLSHGIKISTEFASIWDYELHNSPAYLEPNSRILLGVGSSVSGLEVLSGEYLRAWAYTYIRDLFKQHNLDAIVTPMLPILSPKLTDDAKAFGESNTALSMQLMRYSFLANLIGIPAYSVPVGFVSDNDAQSTTPVQLPVGLQLIGTHWTEHTLLRLGHAIEQGHTSKLHRPKALVHFDPFDWLTK
jgi:Asp-tRNA(Asn)/Glu-tRNA(Gln) amidotransferase A subunit family amidase